MTIFTLYGTVIEKLPIKIISEKLCIRDFILKVKESQYPQHIRFTCVNKTCSIVDVMKEGDYLCVNFKIKGRIVKKEDKTKYHNQLEVVGVIWK